MSEKIDKCGSAADSVTPNGDLNVPDYSRNVPLTKKVVQDIPAWAEKQRETTRTKLVLCLVRLFGYSLLGTFILAAVATFSPQADKELIKDLVSQLITTQSSLLLVAFSFYFRKKED